MGCHTWMHTKCNEDFESIKARVKECLIYACQLHRRFDLYSKKTIKQLAARWLKDEFERGYTYSNNTGSLYIDLSGKNLTDASEWFHDTVRVTNYPDDELFSYQETLDFIERNKADFYTNSDVWQDRLQEFWLKHPDGMISFG